MALHLPLRVSYAIAICIADARSLLATEDILATAANLKVIFPGISDREVRVIQKKMFRNFGKYLVDFFRFAKLDKAYIRDAVRFENLRSFEAALARHKGVIALTAHLGNWELAGACVSLSGYPVVAVALPHANKKVNDFFNNQRKSKGISVVPLGRAARSCFDALSTNKIVALIGDRDFLENGRMVDFFGKPTHFPVGPAAFCLKTGAPLVPAFILRNPDDTFTFRVEKPMAMISTGDKDKDIGVFIDSYKVIIEDYIRSYPDQWFMFRRFWAE